MIKEKLFAVAIFAFKPDPTHTVHATTSGGIVISFPSSHECGDVSYDIQPAFDPSYELTVSKEIAEEMAVQRAKELYPESEGWMMHQARAQEVDAEDILRASANLSFGSEPTPSEDSTDEVWPDMIM